MSKYIIDTGDYLFTTDGVLVVGFDCDNKPATFYNSLDNLEELNSDYINENFGELQDGAYRKGYDDGKDSLSKGCEGCRYTSKKSHEEPCFSCTRNHMDQYEPMSKQDDRIEVGDEVRNKVNGLTYIVTLASECGYVLLGSDGNCATSCVTNSFEKTGKHYDIQSILGAMKS